MTAWANQRRNVTRISLRDLTRRSQIEAEAVRQLEAKTEEQIAAHQKAGGIATRVQDEVFLSWPEVTK